jgi:hypothetical protein
MPLVRCQLASSKDKANGFVLATTKMNTVCLIAKRSEKKYGGKSVKINYTFEQVSPRRRMSIQRICLSNTAQIYLAINIIIFGKLHN